MYTYVAKIEDYVWFLSGRTVAGTIFVLST